MNDIRHEVLLARESGQYFFVFPERVYNIITEKTTRDKVLKNIYFQGYSWIIEF